MHAELGNFWMNLLFALSGFLYGSYRLAKQTREEERLEKERSPADQKPGDRL